MRRSLLFVVVAASGCSSSDLYSSTGQDPLVPDRIAITGDLCTEDTGGSRFPVKVLLMVDGSLDMFNADPRQERFSELEPASINSFVRRNRNQSHVRFGFASIGATSRALPEQVFYRPQDPEVDLALTQLRVTSSDSRRDMINAVSQMESFITADLARSSPGEILRSRYLVYMLLAGPPDPSVTPQTLAEHVERVRNLVYGAGALQFQVNVGLFYFGPRTIQASPAGYGCYTSSGSACSCPPTPGDDYCGVECTLNAGTDYEARMEAAREAYRSVSFVGNGRLEEFPCASQVALGLNIATGAMELVKKDIVAFNTNVRLGPEGPMVDSDGDGLSDLEEASSGTDPLSWDTDGDGLGDRVEARTAPRQDPLNPLDRPRSCADPGIVGVIPDTDLDLLNDCEEGLLEASASIPDTDGDGLPDYLELMAGTLPISGDDRLLDFDADGIINGDEVLEHTDPRTNDARQRGAEGYRNSYDYLGRRAVPSMEDSEQLHAVEFLRASGNVVGGPAYLKWDAAARTLSWSDARVDAASPYLPIPTAIDQGSGRYTLVASNAANGDQVWIDVLVYEDLLPSNDIEVRPLITVSERNCYGVRLSNIKLMHTQATASEPRDGMNRIYVFFTQGPADRLETPGISQVAEVRVRFKCNDPNDIASCARNPAEPAVELTTDQFVSAAP